MSTGLRDYYTLCKPRVVMLMLLTAWAGMYLASETSLPWWLWFNATLGIAFMSGSAATLNHIIDHKIDAIMDRTRNRPLPKGKLSIKAAGTFAALLGVSGFFILYFGANKLTALMTLLAAIGYSAIYSLYLKRATSQNIVIGGLSGAMPPLLVDCSNWHTGSKCLVASANYFCLTPPHFGRYVCIVCPNIKTGIPMLPITHGVAYTKLNIVLYKFTHHSLQYVALCNRYEWAILLISAVLLNAGLIFYAIKLKFNTEEK